MFSVARVSLVSSRSYIQRLQFSCSCVVRFQLLVCRAFFSCSCVEGFQLFVCPAFSAARVWSVFSCSRSSCAERSQLIVCWALSVFTFTLFMRRAFSVARMSIERFQLLYLRFSCVERFQLLVCRAFLVARVPCYSPVRRGSSGAFKGAFNLRCLEVLPLLILGYLVCLILPL